MRMEVKHGKSACKVVLSEAVVTGAAEIGRISMEDQPVRLY